MPDNICESSGSEKANDGIGDPYSRIAAESRVAMQDVFYEIARVAADLDRENRRLAGIED